MKTIILFVSLIVFLTLYGCNRGREWSDSDEIIHAKLRKIDDDMQKIRRGLDLPI